MGFFDPIEIAVSTADEDDREKEERRVQPEWLGPPETVIGGVVQFRAPLHHDDRLAIWVDRLLVYRTGLEISLELYVVDDEFDGREISGRFPWALMEKQEHPVPWGQREAPSDAGDYFRFGVRYGDGRTAVTTTWDEDKMMLSRLREDPPQPDDLVLISREGSGGPRGASMKLWAWPAPAVGPVDLVAEWPALGVGQVIVTVPESAIEPARKDISNLWPDPT